MRTFYLQIKKWAVCLMVSLCLSMSANAQIGYQISLLNTATGEPRANETVNVTATITDSTGGVIYTGTQSVTSNDFGVLSLTVGNVDTFSSLDLQEHRLPFFIEVSANGAMIGKSQILSVPVAEVAKQLEPGIEVEDLVGTWKYSNNDSSYNITFFNNGKVTIKDYGWTNVHLYPGDYTIDGNNVFINLEYGYLPDGEQISSHMQGLCIAQIHNGILHVNHRDFNGNYSKQDE